LLAAARARRENSGRDASAYFERATLRRQIACFTSADLENRQNKTPRVEEPKADDHSPKISPRRKNQKSHQNAKCADAERILAAK
jgi:hypothetical protein